MKSLFILIIICYMSNSRPTQMKKAVNSKFESNSTEHTNVKVFKRADGDVKFKNGSIAKRQINIEDMYAMMSNNNPFGKYSNVTGKQRNVVGNLIFALNPVFYITVHPLDHDASSMFSSTENPITFLGELKPDIGLISSLEMSNTMLYSTNICQEHLDKVTSTTVSENKEQLFNVIKAQINTTSFENKTKSNLDSVIKVKDMVAAVDVSRRKWFYPLKSKCKAQRKKNLTLPSERYLKNEGNISQHDSVTITFQLNQTENKDLTNGSLNIKWTNEVNNEQERLLSFNSIPGMANTNSLNNSNSYDNFHCTTMNYNLVKDIDSNSINNMSHDLITTEFLLNRPDHKNITVGLFNNKETYINIERGRTFFLNPTPTMAKLYSLKYNNSYDNYFFSTINSDITKDVNSKNPMTNTRYDLNTVDFRLNQLEHKNLTVIPLNNKWTENINVETERIVSLGNNPSLTNSYPSNYNSDSYTVYPYTGMNSNLPKFVELNNTTPHGLITIYVELNQPENKTLMVTLPSNNKNYINMEKERLLSYGPITTIATAFSLNYNEPNNTYPYTMINSKLIDFKNPVNITPHDLFTTDFQFYQPLRNHSIVAPSNNKLTNDININQERLRYLAKNVRVTNADSMNYNNSYETFPCTKMMSSIMKDVDTMEGRYFSPFTSQNMINTITFLKENYTYPYTKMSSNVIKDNTAEGVYISPFMSVNMTNAVVKENDAFPFTKMSSNLIKDVNTIEGRYFSPFTSINVTNTITFLKENVTAVNNVPNVVQLPYANHTSIPNGNSIEIIVFNKSTGLETNTVLSSNDKSTSKLRKVNAPPSRSNAFLGNDDDDDDDEEKSNVTDRMDSVLMRQLSGFFFSKPTYKPFTNSVVKRQESSISNNGEFRNIFYKDFQTSNPGIAQGLKKFVYSLKSSNLANRGPTDSYSNDDKANTTLYDFLWIDDVQNISDLLY